VTRAIAAAAMTCMLATTQSLAADARPPEYEKLCAKCHLEGGTGTFMLGRRLGKEKALLDRRDDLREEYIRHVVRNGVLSMPAITRVEVTDAELDAIVRFLTRAANQ
jgi:cytochrome c5